MQAEIWRAASHLRFYTRYFRVFPGFLGSKSFLNFFKKRVLGPVFTPQSSFRRTRRAVSASPPHALHPRIFEDFFSPHCPPEQQAPQSSHSGKRSQDSRPPPPFPKAKTSGDTKTSRDNKKSPEANLGASVERLTRLELATSTLARWCSTN